ncbi:hypothetical protein [Shewanella woodyi]|uniref:Uncharacterized protein n=1 Tax=Shewanella woodyi (strain ATCC 51908 / MS32) TaxID=392500 RepID=B1KET5_SHEWM|nr:hypothetical protein [Shewanella woodyi]ACA88100.1 hypothetical protein Swoo_3841 [Shewanella woodyi ATCC 51908]
MKYFFFLFLIVAFDVLAISDYCKAISNSYCNVSLVAMVSSPDDYNERKIIVSGTFKQNGDKYYLFIDSEKAKNNLFVDSIRIDISEGLAGEILKSSAEVNFVTFKGTFYTNNFDGSFGTLKNVVMWFDGSR